MRRFLCFFIFSLLVGCQTQSSWINVRILDRETIVEIRTSSKNPLAIMEEAGIALSPTDKIEFRGADLPLDFSLPAAGHYTLQIRRTHTLTLETPERITNIQTTEPTIGLALAQTGLEVFSSDILEPAPATPIDKDLKVKYQPARELTIKADGKLFTIKSTKPTTGQALAASGYALLGADFSLPAESSPLPTNGQIEIVRVREVVTLKEKTLPFLKKYEYSVTQAAGEQKVLQIGELGLAISRARVRYENEAEVDRKIEAESIVRNPIDSIISLSSQVQVQTISTPQGPVQYWRAIQMYTTAYSPCRSGTTKCSYGTASGMPVKHGVVAVVPALFNQLAGSRVYIPGYGIGVIGDVGGGFPDGRLWIDLGYSDSDYQSWYGFHTVYFLAPAPSSIPAGLN